VAESAPISPELVLVCPELASRARAELPDRPWEAFLPRLPLRAPWTVPPAPFRPAPVQPAARQPPAIERSWAGRVASLFPAVVLGGFVAVIIAGSLPWVGERPTLGPAPPTVQPAVTTPTLPSAPGTTARG
jgi:hypothetical protein